MLNRALDILRGDESLVHSTILCDALAAAACWVLLGYGSTGQPLELLGDSLEAGLIFPEGRVWQWGDWL